MARLMLALALAIVASATIVSACGGSGGGGGGGGDKPPPPPPTRNPCPNGPNRYPCRMADPQQKSDDGGSLKTTWVGKCWDTWSRCTSWSSFGTGVRNLEKYLLLPSSQGRI